MGVPKGERSPGKERESTNGAHDQVKKATTKHKVDKTVLQIGEDKSNRNVVR